MSQNKKTENLTGKEDKTIKWFKIECSFLKEPFGVKHWGDVIDFLSKTSCFDYVIKGQTTEPFEGVNYYWTELLGFYKVEDYE